MLKPLLTLLLLSFTASSLSASEQDKERYHMFPQPAEGQERYIIEVPQKPYENDYRVELLVGKEMLADCNTRQLFGKVEKRPLQGWGYHYYVVSDINGGVHTMMVCKEPKEERFVALAYKELLRYNSRLGTVVYVPQGYEVRYRIWHADEESRKAQSR
jgi:ecotin